MALWRSLSALLILTSPGILSADVLLGSGSVLPTSLELLKDLYISPGCGQEDSISVKFTAQGLKLQFQELRASTFHSDYEERYCDVELTMELKEGFRLRPLALSVQGHFQTSEHGFGSLVAAFGTRTEQWVALDMQFDPAAAAHVQQTLPVPSPVTSECGLAKIQGHFEVRALRGETQDPTSGAIIIDPDHSLVALDGTLNLKEASQHSATVLHWSLEPCEPPPFLPPKPAMCPPPFQVQSINQQGGRVCMNSHTSQVLGPFPELMQKTCRSQELGVCTDQQWPIAYVQKTFGTGPCPLGAVVDRSFRICVDDQHAYGPFPQPMICFCKAAEGGKACSSMRWHRAFFENISRRLASSTPPDRENCAKFNK